MRHVEKALNKMKESRLTKDSLDHINIFINLENTDDTKGVAPIVSFTIQSDPIGEVGINGVQAVDILEYSKCLFESLNDAFPCQENEATITLIKDALGWQEKRTNDRLKRNVEGKNKA